jgi:hypothetical protein
VDAFSVSILAMIITGFAECPRWPGLSLVFLLAKSFSSRSAALTSPRLPFDQASGHGFAMRWAE